jgi:hypothetical protein
MGNLQEMDIFLDAYDLPNLNQEHANNLKRSTANNKTETLILKIKNPFQQQRKVQDQLNC